VSSERTAIAGVLIFATVFVGGCRRAPGEQRRDARYPDSVDAPRHGPDVVAGAAAPPLGPPSVEVGPPPARIAAGVALVPFLRDLDRPLALEVAPGDRRRIFVVEQAGRIRIVEGGALAPRPFLDLEDLVSRGHDEQGLLGLAFAPDYATTGRFVVNYTDRDGDTRVVEYLADPRDPTGRAPTRGRVLLAVAQPWANHNGGGVEFGPDGKLYVGLGDGGDAGDPRDAAQDDRSRLGKLLALDLADGAVEVAAKGLRNPWRYAFDPATRDLYVGDVGQHAWEEIDVVPFEGLRGRDFGWRRLEGDACFRASTCERGDRTPPAIAYDHQAGCSVTGGEVYRGVALPALAGAYFYADYCTGLLRSFRWRDGAVHDHWDWKAALDPSFRLARLASFGVDHDGELYLLSLDGVIYRFVPRS
jgi:glucose/arabinose dehydrogenase